MLTIDQRRGQLLQRKEELLKLIELEREVSNLELQLLGLRGNGADANTVLSEVAKFFDVTIQELRTRSRKRLHYLPRRAAMLMLRRLLKMSYPKIGDLLEQTHSNIYRGIDCLIEEQVHDKKLQERIAELELHLRRLLSIPPENA